MQKIYNTIDNITPTTREFAEKRVEQLKAKLEGIDRRSSASKPRPQTPWT